MTEALAFHVGEMREELADAQGWRCEHCGGPFKNGVQLAHRIPKKKHLISMYGEAVIHHRRNLAAACSLECNAALDIGGNPEAVRKLVAEIKAEIDG
jgi:hypothetical protein